MINICNHWMSRAAVARATTDGVMILVGAAIAQAWFRSGAPADFHMVLPYALVLIPMTIALNAWFGLYSVQVNRLFCNTVARALVVLYIAGAVAYCMFAAFPLVEANRAMIESSIIIGIFGTLIHRVHSMHSATQRKNRVLIFGTGPRAVDVKSNLEQYDRDIEIVGFYCPHRAEVRAIRDELLVGDGMSLLEVVRSLNIDEVVVAVTERRGGGIPLEDLLHCKLLGVNVIDLATHFERSLGQVRLDALKAGWLVFGDGFDQSLGRQFIKRAFDIVVASALLILTLPLMILAAIAIVLEDGFPIIYRQERVGWDGGRFKVIKFRSMRKDAEKDGKPRFAVVKDARITRVGRLIRKCRIDELPQLLSVIKGHMSLVGPRPERPFFVEQLVKQVPYYSIRHYVKPGLTGWAQVRFQYGGSLEDSAEKLQYDLYYVKNHSLFLDLVILFETVRVVVTGRGAC